MLLWLLSILIAAMYLCAIVTAVVVGLRARRDEGNRFAIVLNRGRLPGPSSRGFSLIKLADAFDPQVAAIWETQIPALELINSAGKEGIVVSALEPFYNSSVKSIPELYEGSSFEGWVQFLRDADLVKQPGARLLMTASGSEFLRLRCTQEQHMVHGASAAD